MYPQDFPAFPFWDPKAGFSEHRQDVDQLWLEFQKRPSLKTFTHSGRGMMRGETERHAQCFHRGPPAVGSETR